MQLGERFSILLKILLPVFALWLLNIAPNPHRYTSGLREARQAQLDGQHQLAAARLRSALAAEPAHSELWEQIGLEELAAGRDAEAQQALLNAQAAGYFSPQGRLALGDLIARQGDAPGALAIWQALLADEGPSVQIYQRLVRLFKEQHDDPSLQDALRAWHELAPTDAQVSYALGLSLTVQAPTEALNLLMAAARLDPALDQSVQVLRRGINQAAVADNAGYGWVMIGRALGSLNEWRLACRAFEQAVAVTPSYAEAWAFLGEARFQTGESGESELEKANSITPQSPLVQAITALYWRRQGKLEEALRYLQEVARQEPDEEMWQIELGHTLVEMGDLQTAQAHYQRAVRLAPNSSPAWQALARFSIDYNINIRDLGLPAARQASVLAPQDPAALDLMGLAFFHLEDTISAERFLQRAIEEDATFAEAYLHLGQLYLQQQDSLRARDYLRQALALAQEKPVGEMARRMLQRYFQEGG